MLLVYCDHITPRITYTFNFILHTLCGFDYRLISEENEYRCYNGATLNYSHKQLRENDVEIRPNGLLFFKTIANCEALIKEADQNIYLFLKAEGVDISTFDPFAASFYLLTRYEEYIEYMRDVHNRFEAASSCLFKYKVLYRPLVNEWAEALKQTLLRVYPDLRFRSNSFSCKISIDVDQAFAFRHRGLAQNTGALLKNIVRFNQPFLKSQLQTILFHKTDAYDTFEYLRDLQHALGIPAIYFINAGTFSKYDKNLPLSNGYFKKLLNVIKEHAEVGLHPSYYTDVKPEKITLEKEELEAAIGEPITQSRQHYLKLFFPQTYKQLLHVGITKDYSMGYASHPGFRAGTCSPFQWFDLAEDRVTPLSVYPVTYMEGSFAQYLKLQPEETLNIIKRLTDTVRSYNGCLISIWHNHTVNNQFSWKGWKAVFEESLHYIINRQA